MNLEPAAPGDLPELTRLWNSAMGDQFPLTERLLAQTVEADPYHEPAGSIVVRDGDRLIGWVLCKSMEHAGPEIGRFQGRGGIGALCVDPEHQRRGIGSRLLDAAETYLRAHGSPISTLYFPHHLLPGVPETSEAAVTLFTKRGYTKTGLASDLWRALGDFEISPKAQAAIAANPDVQLRPARQDEADAVINFVAGEFAGGWDYSTRRHFKSSGRASDILVAVEKSEVIGFCHTADWTSQWLLPSIYWHGLMGERYGGLGPIGIAKQQRKRGLGLALFAVSVSDLKRRGVERMGIDWTGLVDFYGVLGFTVWKRYVQMELKP